MPEVAVEELARFLSTLGNANRLELLRQLRRPKRIADLRASPETLRPGENPERHVSRQAVRQHLERLLSADVAQIHRRGSAYEGNEYLLNHRQLFLIAEQLRDLARFDPVESPLQTETRAVLPTQRPVAGSGRSLVLVHGIDEGRTWPLAGPQAILLGRARDAHVRLDYDPFISSRHAELAIEGDRVVLRDLGSRNGTFLNFVRLRSDSRSPLVAGDVVNVGRSSLVYRS